MDFLTRKKHIRAYSRKRRTGVTTEQYEKMLIDQNYCCAICGINEKNLKETLNADHSHITDKFRGLLCARCNLGLGMFKDTRELLIKAISYLEKS